MILLRSKKAHYTGRNLAQFSKIVKKRRNYRTTIMMLYWGRAVSIMNSSIWQPPQRDAYKN